MSAPSPPPRRPDVLIVSVPLGAGHTQAARAVHEALRDAAPHLNVEHVDALDFAPEPFRIYYRDGYELAMSRFPVPYGACFRLWDRPHRPGRSLTERLRLGYEGLFMRRFARFVAQRRPPVVVHTHFLAPAALRRPVARGRVATRQMIVVTDVHVHRWWYCEQIAHWFVPAESTARRLRLWGIDPAGVTVSGIPILKKWTAPMDRRRLRAKWGLPAGAPVVLLSSGAEFVCGPVVHLARRLLALREGLRVVVLAGRSRDLLGRLRQLPESANGRLQTLGFTEQIHELVELASLVVTKPGGIATAECLAKGKPMIFPDPVPGQELCNAEYLARQGAGVVTAGADEAVAAVCRLLGDAQAMGAMAARARSLYRPASRIIAEKVASAAAGDDDI
jgi:processive 1,2-diacylglycerol beta-glucosyltransferase